MLVGDTLKVETRLRVLVELEDAASFQFVLCDSHGGFNTILPKETPSFGVLTLQVENAVDHMLRVLWLQMPKHETITIYIY